MSCEHHNFTSSVRVGRLVDAEGGKVTGYSVDLRIQCLDCHLPFEFIGAPNGYSPNKPMASIDNEELRIPIRPTSDPVEDVKAYLRELE